MCSENWKMNRLTLSRQYQSIDFRQCLPAGDSLPSWSMLPLDAKLPMYRTPKGHLTLYTTPVSDPKYRSGQCIDFDLSDPNGVSSSPEYHSLHDPHLKSHFSIPAMKRHLVRNGFITQSGEVICTLKEFNKYRQYLRRLCLLEVTQERRKELAKSPNKRVKREIPGRYMEVKQRQQEIMDKLKQRHKDLAKQEVDRMEKWVKEQMEREKETEDRRKSLENKRHKILLRHKDELKKRNVELFKRWIMKERERERRLEEQKREMVLRQTERNLEKWGNRKLHEQERLETEKVIRGKEEDKLDENIKNREEGMRKLHNRQIAEIEELKQARRRRHQERELDCAQRLARKIVTGQIPSFSHRRRNRRHSPYISVWHFEEILRLLELSDGSDDSYSRTTSLDFLRHCNYTIDTSNIQNMDMYSGYNKTPTVNFYEGHLGNVDRRDSDHEVEMTFSESAEGRNRSVRFDSDESVIIPNLFSGATLTPGSSFLKPVSEHILTPVPSPVPPDFFRRDSTSIDPIRDDIGVIESLLLRLLDDINNYRLSRNDLDILTSYCIQVLRSNDYGYKISEFQEQPEIKRTSSANVANELVQFTLTRILADIRSGTVDDDDLMMITLALVRQRQQLSTTPLEDDIRSHIIETLERIETDNGIEAYLSDSLEKLGSDEKIDSFIAETLHQVVEDIANNVLSEEDLGVIGSAVVAASSGNLTSKGSSNAEMKSSLENIIETLSTSQLKVDNTLYAIISSYHIVNKQNKLIVKEFVIDIFPQLYAGIEVPQNQTIARNMIDFKQDFDDSLLTDSEMQDIGTMLLNVGKTFVDREPGVSFKDFTGRVEKMVYQKEFKNKARKAFYEYFAIDKKYRSSSYTCRSSVYASSSESKIAVNAVLGTMDQITRDVYNNQIPKDVLGSIATAMLTLVHSHSHMTDVCEGANDIDVLNNIYKRFRENRITFQDTKRLFATIFHSYTDPTTVNVKVSFSELRPEDMLMLGNLIDETITQIIQTVAIEIKEAHIGDEIAVVEIEELVRGELHGPADKSARPPENAQLENNLDLLLQGCLRRAARDIVRYLEAADSELSAGSRTNLGDICFIGKVVDFIVSVFNHLIYYFTSGELTAVVIGEFLTQFIVNGLDGSTDDQLRRLLEDVKLDLEQNREESKYFSKLATLFSQITLQPRSTSSELGIIGRILVSIDIQVLTEFVQTALLSVLTYIQSDQQGSKDLPMQSESSLHQVASRILVRRVIDHVVIKVVEEFQANQAATKKTANKGIFKRFSFKKIDSAPQNQRKLYECVVDAINDVTSSRSLHQFSSPTSLSNTDEKILRLFEEVGQMIRSRNDPQHSSPPVTDDLVAIGDIMKDVLKDMEQGLEHPMDLNVPLDIPVGGLTVDNIEQLALQAIRDALDNMQVDDNDVCRTTSASVVSSKSSHLMIEMFVQVLTHTIDSVKHSNVSRDDLLSLAEQLAHRGDLACPRDFCESMDPSTLEDFVVECLSEFKTSVEQGQLDENIIQDVTKNMAMLNIERVNSDQVFHKTKSISSVVSVHSQEIEIMVKSVLSSIIGDSESLHSPPSATIISPAFITVSDMSLQIVADIKQRRVTRHILLKFAGDLTDLGKVTWPKEAFESLDESMLQNFVVEFLLKIKDGVEFGKLDENIVQNIIRQMSMFDVDKVLSDENCSDVRDTLSLCSVPSTEIDVMVKSVLSSIMKDSELPKALFLAPAVSMFCDMSTLAISNIKQEKVSREKLLTFAVDLANKGNVTFPLGSFESMEFSMLRDFVVECLLELEVTIKLGKSDEETIYDITTQISPLNTNESSSTENLSKIRSSPSVNSVPSMVIEVMVKSVLSSIMGEFELKQPTMPTTSLTPVFTTGNDMSSHSSNSLDSTNSGDFVTLTPILGFKPLDVCEDVISPALSAITMKTRASHHCAPDYEQRQSYASLVCPDLRDNIQAKSAIKAIIGTQEAVSGAAVVNDDSASDESSGSNCDSHIFTVTKIFENEDSTLSAVIHSSLIGSSSSPENSISSTAKHTLSEAEAKTTSSRLRKTHSEAGTKSFSSVVKCRSTEAVLKDNTISVMQPSSDDELRHASSRKQRKQTSSESVSKIDNPVIKYSSSCVVDKASTASVKHSSESVARTSASSDSTTGGTMAKQRSSEAVTKSKSSTLKSESPEANYKASNSSLKQPPSDTSTKSSSSTVKQTHSETTSQTSNRAVQISASEVVATKSSSSTITSVKSTTSRSSTPNVTSSISKILSQSKQSNSSLLQQPSRSRTSQHEEKLGEVRGIVFDSRSQESQTSAEKNHSSKSQNDVTEVQSVCGSHRSTIVVRESDDSL